MQSTSPPSMLRCSLKTCFLVCATMQVMFMLTFGPGLFDNALQKHYISDDTEANETMANITNASSTTHPPPLPTPPTRPGDVKQKATLFIQWYDTMCKAARKNTSEGLCPCIPPELKGRLHIETSAPSWDRIEKANSVVKPGGEWSPADCRNTEKVAIVIPYRDREEHLRIFLNHMHPILRRQKISYRIFVVEQALPEVFNKASMMNVGFAEAMKSGSYDCVIFHDVDMLLEDDRHFYRCSQNIRHMGANVNKFGYRLAYYGLIGGASAFRKEHFQQVNGFTNKFYGWGGEDDDMWQRILVQKLKVVRFPPAVSRYTMLKHGRDKSNKQNPYSGLGWQSRPKVYEQDGLRSLKYRIHETKLKPLYTWIYAELITALENFSSYWGYKNGDTYLTKKLSLVDCATECMAQSACKSFMMANSMCKLKSTAFLRSQCRPFQCDLLYIKKLHSRQLEYERVLHTFVEIPGNCGDIGRKSSSQKLDFLQCAGACENTSACLAFVHSTDPDACYMPPAESCSVTEPSKTSSTFFKIPPNILTHFTNRGGDCLGGDIEGAFLTVEQCAMRCRLTDPCVGFAYAEDSEKSCWLKKESCTNTTDVKHVTMYDRT
ncbi:Beta-1,4-galactosyltransferase 2 [Lamellibrachia satsuma]|nr:Beta-1,4-galactosyltransferase 2 [Lamellibrachia satsuma]